MIKAFSDLHLEDLDTIYIEKHSDILFLAGDIGHIDDPKYINFLDMCSIKWKTVISVLGNHEYYSTTESIQELYLRYKELYDKYHNIFLLEQQTMCLENINIIGTTSWGHFKEGHIGGSPIRIMHTKQGNLKQIGCKNIYTHQKCAMDTRINRQ